MPTNLDIDSRLLDQAVKVSGERTKTAAVTRALREYVDLVMLTTDRDFELMVRHVDLRLWAP